MVGSMRVDNGQHHGPDVCSLEPERQLPTDQSARGATPQPCHDFNAPPVSCFGAMHEVKQALKSVLHNISMQIQLRIDLELPAGEALPARIIQTR